MLGHALYKPEVCTWCVETVFVGDVLWSLEMHLLQGLPGHFCRFPQTPHHPLTCGLDFLSDNSPYMKNEFVSDSSNGHD